MYLEHQDTARLERAQQASAFLCEFFRFDLEPDVYRKLDQFHGYVTAAIVQRAADRAKTREQ